MIQFVLNSENVSTGLPAGTTVLDFVRYRQNLKGTKIGCREGDCGACTVLVGELSGDNVKYRSMTSCLMPLANAAGKHIVTIEGINPADGSLTPVQRAMLDESGTQCGFCTVGFIMSLTGFCIDETEKTPAMAVSAVDGNICRCTGYKSIERAAKRISEDLTADSEQSGIQTAERGLRSAINKLMVPEYFSGISDRLKQLATAEARPARSVSSRFVGGGTDLYVQRPDEMSEGSPTDLFDLPELRDVRDAGAFIEIGSAATVTDLLVSPVMQGIFPDLHKHLKLISSTPIRNMATLAGNFVNASPIGDMTVWFLALDSSIVLSAPPAIAGGPTREIRLRDLYTGYKQLTKREDEIISLIRFRKPDTDFRFNFEKVCKRTYLDIATVNTAISLKCTAEPGKGWVPPALYEALRPGQSAPRVSYVVDDVHVAAGGVAPIPLYLKQTSEYLTGRQIDPDTIAEANEIMQAEVSPISDVRGTEEYKRLLLRQLFTAHFVELFGVFPEF